MVYLPTTAAEVKVGELRKRGARVVQHGSDFMDAERAALAASAAKGLTYVSAYNDLQVLFEPWITELSTFDQETIHETVQRI